MELGFTRKSDETLKVLPREFKQLDNHVAKH
jgi:hypothetical protein